MVDWTDRRGIEGHLGECRSVYGVVLFGADVTQWDCYAAYGSGLD